MDPEPIVFDISSDEESSGCREEPKGYDFDWLADFLGIGDKPTGEYSDEVVVLREVKSTAKSKSSKPTVRVEDEDDDDCVVLDGDPDKPVVGADSNSSGGSDELLIVGEKGQIACRDFPHSRHLCASFPFRTTPHEKHCNLCHCYVCDSPAPCARWSTFNSGIDHCHATDKEETWKTQRRNLQSGQKVPLPAPKLSESFQPLGLPQTSPLNIARMPPNSRPQNQIPRPGAIQGSSSTNFSVPTILSRSRSPRSGLGLPNNRAQPRVVAGGPSVGVIHHIRRAKGGQPIANSAQSLVRPLPALFKRTASVGVSLPACQTTIHSSNSRISAVSGQNARTTAPVLNNLNPSRWENVNSSAPLSSSQPNLGTGALISTPPSSGALISTPPSPVALIRTMPSQQQWYSQPVPIPTDGQNFHQHENPFKSNGQSVDHFRNETQNNSGQTLYPGDVQSESAKAASSIDYDPRWVISACKSNEQQPSPAEHSQLQGIEPSNEPFVESNSDFSIGDTTLNSDYAFDDWLLDGPSVPVVSDGIAPQSNNIFSPESTPIDTERVSVASKSRPRRPFPRGQPTLPNAPHSNGGTEASVPSRSFANGPPVVPPVQTSTVPFWPGQPHQPGQILEPPVRPRPPMWKIRLTPPAGRPPLTPRESIHRSIRPRPRPS